MSGVELSNAIVFGFHGILCDFRFSCAILIALSSQWNQGGGYGYQGGNYGPVTILFPCAFSLLHYKLCNTVSRRETNSTTHLPLLPINIIEVNPTTIGTLRTKPHPQSHLSIQSL